MIIQLKSNPELSIIDDGMDIEAPDSAKAVLLLDEVAVYLKNLNKYGLYIDNSTLSEKINNLLIKISK